MQIINYILQILNLQHRYFLVIEYKDYLNSTLTQDNSLQLKKGRLHLQFFAKQNFNISEIFEIIERELKAGALYKTKTSSYKIVLITRI